MIKAIRKAAEEARKETEGRPKVAPTIEVDLDLLEEFKQEKQAEDNRPRLIMESEQKPKLKVLSLESSSYGDQVFDEEIHDSPYKTRVDTSKTKESPQPKEKPKPKTPIISFTPKNIVQGIVLSEILKRPKY